MSIISALSLSLVAGDLTVMSRLTMCLLRFAKAFLIRLLLLDFIPSARTFSGTQLTDASFVSIGHDQITASFFSNGYAVSAPPPGALTSTLPTSTPPHRAPTSPTQALFASVAACVGGCQTLLCLKIQLCKISSGRQILWVKKNSFSIPFFSGVSV